MQSLSDKKRKEWRQWGKDAYKSTARMMRTNSHHPDYDTPEKREAVHNRYGDSYLLGEERREVLKTKWGYSDNAITDALLQFKDGYDASRKWYEREDKKMQAIIDEYRPLFDEAEKLANSVDVSDIHDGFPCGSAHLYLDYAERETPLGKALAHFNDGSTTAYKYALPIKIPFYGQCVSYDERICSVVADFLRPKGVMACSYTWID